ncbi:uncharacterized protein LODBEIA_P13600 [Lodderomyces beijingensis]|uniref:BAR domain-containing protein n=1 Tax=Lodderomyces beijingensis TaxID=1775926 RepID=A0ABP0ZG25_9ASCO
MSWIGLKKAVNRAGTQIMLKTGQIEQTVDKEFEFEEKRFKTMEANSLALQKRLRTYLDSLKLLTTSQIHIAELLNSFYGSDSSVPKVIEDAKTGRSREAFQNLVGEYYNTLKRLNDECVNELERPYNQTVLNPMSKFNSYYVEVNEAIKKRHNKLLDYDAMRNKLKKLLDTPQLEYANYDVKLKEYNEELAELEHKYSDINNQLKDELPKLINMRVAFFDPSFESFVKIQLRFFNENYQQLNALQSKLDAQAREDYIEGRLEERIDDVLDKMRMLDIAGNTNLCTS